MTDANFDNELKSAIAAAPKTTVMSNGAYDALKWITTIALPALGTLYATLAGVWGFPAVTEVSATFLAVTTCMGVLLGLSNANYKASGAGIDGVMTVDTSNPDKDVYGLALHSELETLADRKQITFAVDTKK